jgi:hydroxypyruvate isomerase
MPDEQGADNCVAFLNRVKAHAEDKGVTICMELLNSKVNHKDYMCDHARGAWP